MLAACLLCLAKPSQSTLSRPIGGKPPATAFAGCLPFDKLRQVPQAAIVKNKRLGAALAFIREQQIERAEARSRKAPRRRDQRDARLFKVG